MDFLDPKVHFYCTIRIINLGKLIEFLKSLLGKYSSNSFQDDNISPNGNQTTTSTTDTNKKLEEITPLLHQASISSTNSIEHGGESSANANPSSTATRNGAHKNYRKRVKTKLSRKTA